MKATAHEPGAVPSPAAAAALASAAVLIPLLMSASSAPVPHHPGIFIWYRSLRKPWFKPPDWVIPLAWSGIEGSLAVAGYRLLRAPSTPAKPGALALLGWNVLMIGGWSRLFFKRRNLAMSTMAAASMVMTGAELTCRAKRVDTVASRARFPSWPGSHSQPYSLHRSGT